MTVATRARPGAVSILPCAPAGACVGDAAAGVMTR